MSEKPGDFFLGVIDFFGILVPGIALLILQGSTLAQLAAISVPQAHNWWDWVPAVVAAYVAGQFLLGVGVPLNRLASIVFPEAKDQFFQAVRDQVPLPPNVPRTRPYVFNAAFSFVRLESPSALAEVERQAAEYKLFRSLTLLFVLDGLLVAVVGPFSPRHLLIDAVLTLGAGARFLFLLVWTQRLAFEFFAMLTRHHPPLPKETGRSA
jgi:hypothetical protein